MTVLSTDHLHTGQGESESSDGSTSSAHLRKQPACGRRVSSHLRSRLCLSLGADLDQLLQEDSKGGGGGGSEAARLNRLNLISSSLSLHRCLSSSSLSSCSTPPRCQSLSDLVEVRGRRSNPPAVCTRAHDEDQSKQVRTCRHLLPALSRVTCLDTKDLRADLTFAPLLGSCPTVHPHVVRKF